MCPREFLGLEANDAGDHFKYVTETTKAWDTSDPSNQPKPRQRSTAHFASGLYQLGKEDKLKLQINKLAKRLEDVVEARG